MLLLRNSTNEISRFTKGEGGGRCHGNGNLIKCKLSFDFSLFH